VATLLDLSGAVEARDPYSSGHAARVMVLAEVVAARLGLDEPEVEIVRMGAALHDIGKIAVSHDVLFKAGPLSEREVAEVRSHPSAGARMVELVRPLRPAVPAVLHHHERWDGRGYPHGLAGTDIPVAARILAVADTFDAMTSNRSYRRALTEERALAELERCAGTQFDPDVVAVFVAAWREGAFAPSSNGLRVAASSST
jgi:HD-GYP domain-containing protein (c-di-GMP phosphodiesterase class II)